MRPKSGTPEGGYVKPLSLCCAPLREGCRAPLREGCRAPLREGY